LFEFTGQTEEDVRDQTISLSEVRLMTLTNLTSDNEVV